MTSAFRWTDECTRCHKERELESRKQAGMRPLCDACAALPWEHLHRSDKQLDAEADQWLADQAFGSNGHGAGAKEEEVELAAIPEYPLDVLPTAAQALVEHGGLPSALTAGACLAALAGAIGPGAEFAVTEGWLERAILWPVLIAPRGAGKSPAQALAFGPLRDHDAEVEDDEPTIRLGDMTLEALARALHRAHGAAVLDVDELAQLLRGLGEYKGGGGGDRGRLLSLWDGAPWSLTRVAGSRKAVNGLDLRIPRPTLAICGTLQPALHELLGGEMDGFRPRWLPHLSAMPREIESIASATPTPAWTALIERLIDLREQRRTCTLSSSARYAFAQHRAEWKRQARGSVPAGVSAALDKGDRHLARIALVLAEAETPGQGGTVGPDLIERAAAIVTFTVDCWLALPEQGGLGLSRRDEKLDRGADRLREWLEEHGTTATRRQLQRAHVAGVRKASDLDALLRAYEATYPGTVTEGVPPGGGLKTILVRAPVRRPIR